MRTLGQASTLTAREWKKLEKNANPTHALIWALTRYTAARIGEVLQLRVKDVYLDAAKRIPQDSVCYRRETRKGKDKNHVVPICSELRAYLKHYPVRTSDKEAYLFPGLGEDSHLSYEAALKYLKRSAEKAELDSKRITTHSGRRSAITQLAQRGTDLRTIQAISGHASIANLQKYIDTDPQRTRLALEGIFA